MMRTDLFLLLAAALTVLGIVRLLTSTDLVRRVIALNIASGGVLMVLLTLAFDPDQPDPIPHALALTGIVITVSVTGLALVIIRRIEAGDGGTPQHASSAATADDGEARPGSAAHPDGIAPQDATRGTGAPGGTGAPERRSGTDRADGES